MLTFPRPAPPDRDRAAEPSSRDPLLVTKLQLPPAPAHLVPRPHLADRIEPLDNQQLTILCAPTGFGKTTALREWSERSSRRIAWLSLDVGDNDPARFWQYVIAALEVWEPGIGSHALSLLRMAEPITLEYVVTSIVNELASQPSHYAIVLDDYHLIDDPAIHRSLRYLLEHLPAQLRLVIASRVDPPLGLPRLRAQGGLIELRGPDLRFTTDEVTAFLIDGLGLRLTTDDVRQLERRTEGWIAGLRLAGTALRQAGDQRAFIERFNGQHRSIGDYLVGEVLDQQPPDVQQFLLDTSILDRLSGPLCDALTGRNDGQTMLDSLERANAFLVPLDDERLWYRYQALFADVLCDRLRRTCPECAAPLHRRAATWCFENRMTREAVAHAMAAGDTELAAEIVEQRACPMLTTGELDTIDGWLAPLPVEMVRQRPILGCLKAWVCVLSGRVDEAEPILDDVERAAAASGWDRPIGEAAAIRAYVARLRHQLPLAIELSARASDLVPDECLSLRRAIALNLGIAYWWNWEADAADRAFQQAGRLAGLSGEHGSAVVALCHRARMRGAQGRLSESAALFEEARDLAERLNVAQLPSQSFVYLGMAYNLIETDDLDGAEQWLRECLRLGLSGGKIDHVILAHIGLTHIQIARGDLTQARVEARDAQTARDRHPIAHVQAAVEANWAALWLAEGDVDAAGRWADDVLARVDSDPAKLCEPERMSVARVRLSQGRPGDALAALQSLLDRSNRTLPQGWQTCRIETLTLLALIQQEQGQLPAALASLEAALHLAETLGHLRTFADHGQPLATLLAQLPASTVVSRAYIDRLTAACLAGQPGRGKPPLASRRSNPLSQRELEVLRAIDDGLSNREIAAALFVTVGTVKRHTNNIYSKLDVGSRTQALARARALNLLGA